jgi:hypothetical protein
MPDHTLARLIFGLALICPLVLSVPATAQKRVALVIGNSAYVNATALANPANDATDRRGAEGGGI